MNKRIIYSLTAWLISLDCAWADGFIINDLTIPQGGEAEMPIGYLFDSGETYVGFQLRLDLPEGISCVLDENNLPVYETDTASLGTGFNITATENNCFAALTKATTTTIKGTEGTLITISLAASSELEVGRKLTVNVTRAMFTSKDAEGGLHSVDIPDFTFTIGEPIDTRTVLNENSTTAPEASDGAVDVRVKRTITAGTWSTLCLPFAMTEAQMKAAFGDDVELADFTGVDSETDEDENVVGLTLKF